MFHRHIHRTYIPDGIYFVTTNVRHHIPFFADAGIAKICEANLWNAFQIQKCVVFAYVLMPDHMHLLVQPTKTTVSEIMRSTKTNASRDINRYLHIAGPGTRDMGFSWQEKFYDHVIGDEHDFRNHIEYIRNNPVKAGHCTKPEECPFLYVDEDAITTLLS